MVKYDKSPIPPPSLAVEKTKGAAGCYNLPDVVEQLKHDFADKCYICELKGLQDPEVEHLIPHHGNQRIDLKFDWNNLFWSCRHCNNVKNKQEYDGEIINCCVEDPEIHISCQYEYDKKNVKIEAKDKAEKSQQTAKLIDAVFNLQNTGIRIIACEHRLNELCKAMNIFLKELAKYKKTGNTFRLKILLKKSAAFAGFKREYIRMQAQQYPELLKIL